MRSVTDPRVAVLASGEGTNVQALLDDPVVGPWIVMVLSDRADAGALARARARGVGAVHVDPVAFDDRASFDLAVLDLLRAQEIEIVALAGFMRVVGPEIVGAFDGRLVNVHPALLPAFPGTSAVADALAWGSKVTGVTVHLVDEEVDHGPVLFQAAVPVEPGDDEDRLHERIKREEHRLLPLAVRLVAEGRVRVEGRRARVVEPEEVAR